MTEIRCSRCGREGQARGAGNTIVPEGWEGWVGEAVCPGCQIAGWHPLCRSLVDEDGTRVAHFEGDDEELVLEPEVAAAPPHERRSETWERCETKDLTVRWEDEEFGEWTCPRCGGTAYMGVRADYPLSGLRGTTITAELEEGQG